MNLPALNDMSPALIILLVILPAFVVFIGLSDHAEEEYKAQGGNGTGGVEGTDEGDGLEDGADQEVDVGVSLELDYQGQGQEGEHVIFSCGYVVGCVLFVRVPWHLHQKLLTHQFTFLYIT
jgi:hypothetical protein